MKKLLSVLMACLLLICSYSYVFAAAGLSNFTSKNQYESGHFVDVDEKQWYAINVKSAYELGLFVGSGNRFNPDGNITIAQTLAVASRLHNTYFDKNEELIEGSPWYQVYVDYAINNGIIGANDFSDYSAKATRAQFASILAKCVDDSVFTAKNEVEDGMIPDVDMKASYAQDVYKLYRTGILVGNNSKGTFTPDSNIKRSAVAAIVTRIVDPSLRESITLKQTHAESISLSKTVLSLTVGDVETITATVSPSGAVEKATWSSSDESVAIVDNGKITATGAGSATIKVETSNGIKTECSITVKQAVLNGFHYEITKQYFNSYTNILDSKQGAAYVEIENTGTVPIYLKEGKFTFDDNNGHLIKSEDYISNCPDVIKPGEKGYFYDDYIQLDDVDVSNGLVFKPIVKLEEAKNPEKIIDYSVSDLGIREDKYFTCKITGRVNNNSTEELKYLLIYVLLLDKDGNVLGITGSVVTNVAAKAVESFEVSGDFFRDDVNYDEIADYKVIARESYYQFSF